MAAEAAVENPSKPEGSLKYTLCAEIFRRLAIKLPELGIKNSHDVSMEAFNRVRNALPPGTVKDLYSQLEWPTSVAARFNEAIAHGKDIVFNIVRPALMAEAPFVGLLPDNTFRILESVAAKGRGAASEARIRAVIGGALQARELMASIASASRPIVGKVESIVHGLSLLPKFTGAVKA